MTDTTALTRTIKQVRDELITQDVKPPVNTVEDINTGFCKHVAETTRERLGNPDDITQHLYGQMGWNHVWLEHNGKHYDAEAPEGVSKRDNLPFFKRE